MKKSQLRNIIKESIKELMTEQASGYTYELNYEMCDGTYIGTPGQPSCEACIVCPTTGPCNPNTVLHPHVGMVIGSLNNPMVITAVTLTAYNGGGIMREHPLGNNACSSTSAGSCNPNAWSNHANWTSTFTNTVANHNNPCNFLNGKITQWTAALQGTGGGNYQNMLNCKLDLANQLHTSNNC